MVTKVNYTYYGRRLILRSPRGFRPTRDLIMYSNMWGQTAIELLKLPAGFLTIVCRSFVVLTCYFFPTKMFIFMEIFSLVWVWNGQD